MSVEDLGSINCIGDKIAKKIKVNIDKIKRD